MATLNPATWHGLGTPGRDRARLPGRPAPAARPGELRAGGRCSSAAAPLARSRGRRCPEWVKHTVRMRHVAAGDFAIPWEGGQARVIGVIPDQIVTESLVEEPTVEDGTPWPTRSATWPRSR